MNKAANHTTIMKYIECLRNSNEIKDRQSPSIASQPSNQTTSLSDAIEFVVGP
jgi:hypothetical protein